MRIRVGNKIIIENATAEVREWCKSNLVLDNPDYYKKERLGKWTGNTPQKIWLYEQMGLDLWVPFGCLKDIWKIIKAHETLFKCEIRPLRRVSYQSCINPYPYQENAIQRILEAKNGVVVMPCGSGKTQTALEAVARIGGKCLWLTHTQDLLNQSMNRAKIVYNLPLSQYGTITAGKVNIGNAITFATIQTLSKIDISAYHDEWDVIIVDECQHCCGSPTRVTQFYKVISRLSARYKVGLTATPKRADGLERSMFALLGGIICEITKEDVAAMTCPVKVRLINTGFIPDYNAILMGDGTLNYSELINNMITDKDRFDYISQAIQSLDGSAIVLANRVDYIRRLTEAYNGRAVCLSTLGNSKKAREERKEVLHKLENGDLDVIFATYQLAKEGLDVPNLRYVVFATPEKDETTVIQSAGRVGRKAKGKEYGTVIDFVDNFGMYRGWAKKRQGFYKKIGAECVDIY